MTRPPYDILEHTADVGLRAYGRTLADLFANAAQGMIALALESPDARALECLPLSATGADREDLLVHWLSEVLYYLDAEGWVFAEFRIRAVEADSIEGEAWGERRDPANRPRAVAVKAVTYHQVSVQQTEEGWEAVAYFDI